jgi:hypothetical protein
MNSTAETGRYLVIDQKTGRKFLVEPIGDPHIGWGDVNVVTKKLEGDYGDKYQGSIREEESIITEDNGFKNIKTLKIGESPMNYINELLKNS